MNTNEMINHLKYTIDALEYKDGVIYGLKYSIRCNGVSGNDIRD